MRLGEHLSPSGEKVVRSLLEESDEFLDTVDALWNLRVLDAEKVFVKINDEIQASIMSSAMRHRFERELTERFGIFKPILLHPTVLWLTNVGASSWRDFRAFGDPPLPRGTSVALFIFMYRIKMPAWVLLLALLVFSAIHPVIVVTLLLCITVVVFQRKRSAYPKGYIPQQRRKVQESGVVDSNNVTIGTQKIDHLEKHYNEFCIPPGKFDAVVLGSDLGGLTLAGILSCLGWRILVLEEGPTLGGGALVRVCNNKRGRKGGVNDTSREFDVGFQSLGATFGVRLMLDTILRFRTTEQNKSGNEQPPLRWIRIGAMDAVLASEIVDKGDCGHLNIYEALFHGEKDKDKIIQLAEESGLWDDDQKPVFVSEMVRVGDHGPLIPISSDQMRLENLFNFFSDLDTSLKVRNFFKVTMNDEVEYIAKLSEFRKIPRAMIVKHIATRFSSIDLTADVRNAAQGKTVEDAFQQQHISLPEAVRILSALFGEESILDKDLSLSAYCNYFMSMTSHPCYPVGGLGRILNGLVEVIQQAGGEVRTSVPGFQLCCNAADGADRDSGGGGGVAVKGIEICSSFCNSGGRCDNDGTDDSLFVPCPVVVSATGALDTYCRRVRSADLNDAGGIPPDLQKVHEGRPRCHLLVEFEGNWVSLRGSSFRFRAIRNSAAAAAALSSELEQQRDDSSSSNSIEWLTITFLEPKDPDTWERQTTRCVISAELPEDCCSRPSHEGSLKLCRPAEDRSTKSHKTIERMQALMFETLHKEFPQTSTAKVLLKQWVEDRLPRLSHTPGRAVAIEGLRPHTPIKGLYLCGRDIAPISDAAGAILGAFSAGEAIVGYSVWDSWMNHSLLSDLLGLL